MRSEPSKDKERTSLRKEVESSDSTEIKSNSFSEQINNFEILEKIGEGGMGVVYKARNTKNRNVFAIKVLNAGPNEDKVALKRFEQEVQAASRLNHSNLVSVYEHGYTSTGTPYMVMEYVKGVTLSDYIKSNHSISETKVIEIFLQICEGLMEAHNNGIIHRDLKPSNILIQEQKDKRLRIKIADFGIARVLNESVDYTQTLTETSEVVGSPKYMSPEQCTGKQLTASSDIYSLGCMLYESVTGEPLFSGSNAIQIILKHINEPSPKLKKQRKLRTLVSNCLGKSAEERYKNVDALRIDLKAVSDGKAVKPIASESDEKRRLIAFSCLMLTFLAIAFAGSTVFYHANKKQETVVLPKVVSSGWANRSERDVATNMQGVAFKHFRNRSYSQAIPALKYVAETYKKSGNEYNRYFAYQCIGQCYLALKQYEEAEPWYRKAINGMSKLSEKRGYAVDNESLSGFVEVLQKQGKIEEAQYYVDMLNPDALRSLESFYNSNGLNEDADRVSKQLEMLEKRKH